MLAYYLKVNNIIICASVNITQDRSKYSRRQYMYSAPQFKLYNIALHCYARASSSKNKA